MGRMHFSVCISLGYIVKGISVKVKERHGDPQTKVGWALPLTSVPLKLVVFQELRK